MPDYRSMFDREYVGAWDLKRDVTKTISKVEAGSVGHSGRKSKKPIIHFEGTDLKLILNKTNGKTIAALYGTDTDKWPGKAVTLFATKASFGGEQVDAIRVRPTVATGADVDTKIDDRPVDKDMRAKQERAANKVATDAGKPAPYERQPGEEG